MTLTQPPAEQPLDFAEPWPSTIRAVVVGANGGLGQAFVERLCAHAQVNHVYALARVPIQVSTHPRLTAITADILDETSLNCAAQTIATQGEVHLVLVATGMLHDPQKEVYPEKSWRSLNAAQLAQNFAINSIGPALVAKNFLPLLALQNKSVFAALSAKVGSIEDNHLGGWYGYRAAKAALNMIVKTLSIELKPKRPNALCVALHPGTVDTALSKPYQKASTAQKLFTPTHAANQLLQVISQLRPDDSGGFFAWDGTRLPY
jgi:NAD(P)-dependent dehydrogenase (short-subunit alcohol dehydrogenase family)